MKKPPEWEVSGFQVTRHHNTYLVLGLDNKMVATVPCVGKPDIFCEQGYEYLKGRYHEYLVTSLSTVLGYSMVNVFSKLPDHYDDEPVEQQQHSGDSEPKPSMFDPTQMFGSENPDIVSILSGLGGVSGLGGLIRGVMVNDSNSVSGMSDLFRAVVGDEAAERTMSERGSPIGAIGIDLSKLAKNIDPALLSAVLLAASSLINKPKQ